MANINNYLFALARKKASLSQKELAQKLGVSQATVSSIESGDSQITDEQLNILSRISNLPIDLFKDNSEVYPLSFNFYRKYASLKSTKREMLEAELSIREFQLDKLLKNINIPTEKLKYFDLNDFNNSPEQLAEFLRFSWKIPRGPIKNLIPIIEEAGILVLLIDIPTREFSGLTIKSSSGIHIIFVNKNMSIDRIRFTAAHEMGHIFMHEKTPNEQMEDEANKFASAFLMPKADIFLDLEKMTITKLELLKIKWKVSMTSILKRALDLGKIEKEKYDIYMRMFSKRGYRYKEPVELDLPDEKPHLLRDIFEFYRNDFSYTENEIYKLIYCTKKDFMNTFCSDETPSENQKLHLVN